MGPYDANVVGTTARNQQAAIVQLINGYISGAGLLTKCKNVKTFY